MGIFACILSLFGCTQKLVKPDKELTSISISQNHMERTYCYSFDAYKKNNTYILNAWCLIEKDNDDIEEISIECCTITEDEFDAFKKLDSKYDFFSLLKFEKKKRFFVLDETITIFSVSYGDESFSLKTNGDCYNEVYDCFMALAKKYSVENSCK